MKKFLIAVMLVFGLIIGTSQAAEADDLVYTGYEKTSNEPIYQYTDKNGRPYYEICRVTIRYYIVPSKIKESKWGHLDIAFVSQIVEFDIQKEGASNYIYKDGQWWHSGVARVDMDGTFHNGLYPAGTEDELDKAVWTTAQPYIQKIKADIERNKGNGSSTNGGTSSSIGAPIGNLPDATKLAELKAAAEPFITQADAKFKAKDYTAAKELFSQAIEKNPYDYHAHDLYARALYREKNKQKNYDLILDEAKKALELASDNAAKADICGFIAKVYRKLAMNNLGDTSKANAYLDMGQKYLDMETKYRQ